eukprot:gene14377-16965_t
MDKYVKVHRQADKPAEPNEIRLPFSNRISGSIEHGINLLTKGDENVVFMMAIGSKLISKAIFATEILKHRVPGLHQITEIGTTGVVTEYLPKEEGLDKVELVKQTPFIRITLSKTPLDTSNPGDLDTEVDIVVVVDIEAEEDIVVDVDVVVVVDSVDVVVEDSESITSQ